MLINLGGTMNTKMSTLKTRETLTKSYCQDEQNLREDLAAAYRLIDYYGMSDMIYGHISLRINEEPPIFLLKPHYLFFDEVCASNLVAVDGNGNKINPTDADISPAGFTIHSAIHLERPDANVILHTHSVNGMSVAAMKEGLLPLDQISMAFYNRIAYHDYEGISFDLDERDRIFASIGQKKFLIMRNHGLLTVGRTVAEAFYYMYYLNKACEVQVNVLRSGAKPNIPPPEVCEHTARQYEEPSYYDEILGNWKANRRLLDRLDPSDRE
ncbi:MAG: class II aldolase/adducin family protein [Moorea sp. SIO3I6]|nr:class II aldolase/adducin family protein [Moorena sp. SIO4A5]NEO49187.1 class II aldolase/adducin family protein [Moorena sp. SIO4A3]NEP27157.1 class II aldolase/adducin family protein [Moorena sp. SIO3I6]NEQ60568.1 class II aldolase/adducin family protein [Moorena sp. SIO4A1]NEQ83464.1 class II aldolase/adducin family protein [Moorena sp. SIO2I5]